MKSKTTYLLKGVLKRATERQLKMFRSEILRITSLIAYIKQFNRLKFIHNEESIPQENLRVIELLEALLPTEDIPENYSKLEVIGSPAIVTEGRVSELILGTIHVGIGRSSPFVKSALQSIDTNMFEPSDISDISSTELSDDSPPQQVPETVQVPEIDDGEPNNKKKKEN